MLEDIKEIYKYREMLKSLVKKELRSRYKASVLGFLWTFLNPLLMLIVYSIVFSVVMRVQVPNYSYTLYLFVGLIPWLYFNTAVQQSSTVMVANSNLIKKVYFPRLILPLSVTLTNLVNMLLTFVIVFAALLISRSPVTPLYLYLPIIVLVETLFVLALSVLFSCITVYLRDLEHIISIVLMAWFYVTPVVFTSDYIPDNLFKIFRLNPMMPIIESYRDILMFNRQPEGYGLLYVLMLSLMLLVAGYYTFNTLQKRFAEEL